MKSFVKKDLSIKIRETSLKKKKEFKNKLKKKNDSTIR